MLTDVSLKNLKVKEKIYKVADRDGMYVAVAPSGQITFRYDYRVNGRRETLTIGRYGSNGMSSPLADHQHRRSSARSGGSPMLRISALSANVGSRKRAWRKALGRCGR